MCLMGFNSVFALSEKRGIVTTNSYSRNVECVGLYLFISHMGLMELTLLGRKFTWFQPNSGEANRLDHCLMVGGGFRGLL